MTDEEIKSFIDNFGKDHAKLKKEFDKKYGSLKRPPNYDLILRAS